MKNKIDVTYVVAILTTLCLIFATVTTNISNRSLIVSKGLSQSLGEVGNVFRGADSNLAAVAAIGGSSAKTVVCTAASIAAGTCGASVPRPPASAPTSAPVSASVSASALPVNAKGMNTAKSVQTAQSSGIGYFPIHATVGQWESITSQYYAQGYMNGDWTGIDDLYYPGDIMKWPDGSQTTVGSSGLSINCVIMGSPWNWCPTDIYAPGYAVSGFKTGSGTGTVSGGVDYGASSIYISGSVTINCGSACSTLVRHTWPVTLTATPASGSTFTGWSGGTCAGTLPTCTFTPTASVSVTAGFNLASTDKTPPVLSGTMSLSATYEPIVNLKWTDSTGGKSGYSIERNGQGASPSFTNLDYVSGTTMSYTDNLSIPSEYIETSRDNPITEDYRVRGKYADSTYTGYSNVAKVHNCVKLFGTGPNAIVFMRGAANGTLSAFISKMVTMVNYGFGRVDPFKAYVDTFSFYADMTKYDDSKYGTVTGGGSRSFFDNITDDILTDGTPCDRSTMMGLGGANPRFTKFIFFHNNNAVHPAYTRRGGDMAWINIDSRTDYLPAVMLHELGHEIGNLWDEYIVPNGNAVWNNSIYFEQSSTRNCTTDPTNDYRGTDNHVYGFFPYSEGCTSMRSSQGTMDTKGHVIVFYRPSEDGLMNGDYTSMGRFNIIDCGYISAALLEPTYPPNRDTAAKYYKTCASASMNTQKSNPPASPAARINPISASSVTPGSTLAISATSISEPEKKPFPTDGSVFDRISYYLGEFARFSTAAVAGVPSTITGSGLSLTDNAVRIWNAATTTEITGLTSDGTTLVFTIPANLPAGSYSLKVGAFNSDWSNAVPLTITAPLVLTVSVSGTGTGTVTGGGVNCTNVNNGCTAGVANGTPITLTATPATGSTFSGWSSSWSGVNCPGTSPTCTFTPTGNVTVTAQFSVIPPTVPAMVAVHLSGSGTGTVTGGGMNCGVNCFAYVEVRPITLTATPAASSTFTGWSGGTCSGTRPTCTFTPIVNMMATANANFNSLPPLPASKYLTLTGTALSSGQISLTWSVTAGLSIPKFTLYDANNIAILSSTTLKTYTITGLTPNTQYCYSVQPSATYWASTTNSVCVTTFSANGNPLPAGKYLTLTATALSQSQIKLAWSVTAGLSIPNFNLYDVTNLVGRLPAGTPLTITASMLSNITLPAPTLSNTTLNTYTFTGLSPNTVHCYVVQPASTYTATTRNSVCVTTRGVYQPGVLNM